MNEYEELILVNANDDGGNDTHPWLVFHPANGCMIIADVYETCNDPTARDFVLTKKDAVILAGKLLEYAKNGTPSADPCVSRYDVEDRVLKELP